MRLLQKGPMVGGGNFSWLRRCRRTIGAFVAGVMLLSALAAVLPTRTVVQAALDPLGTAVEAGLCLPGSRDGGHAPAGHHDDCQHCGPACAVACSAPACALLAIALLAPVYAALDGIPILPAPEARAAQALHPSDAFSQAPPVAA